MNNDPVIIEQILYNATADGIIKITNSEWKGLCYRIPRNRINNCKEIKESLELPGVYILIGKDDDKTCYYIGESDNSLIRLKQHLIKEDYWNTAIVFLGSTDTNLDKAIVKYLEARMCEIAFANHKTNSFKMINGNCPKGTYLSEIQLIKANKYLNGIMIVTGVLGYNLFESSTKTIVDNQEVVFSIELPSKKIKAKGMRVNRGFKVLKGSTCAPSFSSASNECFHKLYIKLRQDEVIVDNIFTVDYIFDSQSAASTQVLGHNSNGLNDWKEVKTKKKLKQIIMEETNNSISI